MSTTSLTINLSESNKTYVETEVAEGRHASIDACIEALIKEARLRQAEEELQALLVEGLESGDPIEITPEFWEERRRRIMERQQKVNGQ